MRRNRIEAAGWQLRIWMAFATVMLFAATWMSAAAQSTTGAGAIQGTVTDAKGAVVPGAYVQVVKSGTGQAFSATTNSVGFYNIPSLFTGDYAISITANSMAKWESQLTLQAGQIAVVNAQLKVGSVTSNVTVVADTTQLINTANSTQATVIGRQQIEQIPQNGRYIGNILGATVPGYQNYGNQPRVNGLVWGAFSWSQDGAPMDYRDGGGLDNVAPDPDTYQEVRVETSNATADSDRPAYAIVSTKSGTNSLHGSAFETNRDNSYGVAHNRQDSISAKPPKYIRNEYGISMGGPVMIPHLYDGRKKTFFFGAWEAMSLRQQSYGYYYVPTDAMRTGDFSGLSDSNGNAFNIYDPDTTTSGSISGSTVTGYQRTQFNYGGKANVINPSRISPLAKTLYAVTPHPTATTSNPYAASTGNWQGAQPNYQQQYDYTMRFDQHFSDSNTAYFRYSLGHRLQYNLGSGGGAPTTDLNWNGQFQPLDSQSGVLGYTHITSPTFFQTVTVSMDYQSWKQQGSSGSVATQNVAANLGLENYFGIMGLPQILGTNQKSQGSQTSLLQGYDAGSNPWRDSDYTNTFADNLTWIKGRHQLKFGGEYRHDQLRILPDQGRSANVSFGGLGTGNLDTTSGSSLKPQPFSGLATADFFIGDAQGYTNNLSPSYLYLRDQETSVYVQDDYHVRPNLTLNLGLRYEALPAAHEKNNTIESFDYSNAAIVTGQSVDTLVARKKTTQAQVNALEAIGVKFETPSQAGMPSGVFHNYWWNFLPRVSAVWQPFGDRRGLVIRGGYGSYAYKTPIRNLYSGGGFGTTAPYNASITQDYSNGYYSDGYNNFILRAGQTVPAGAGQTSVAGLNSSNVIDPNVANSICIGCFGLSVIDPEQKPEGYREWDLAVEKEFSGRTALTVAYMGNHGYNLEQLWYTNTAPPLWVWYVRTDSPQPTSGNTGPNYRSAWREYNQTTYGEIQEIRKTGLSDANMLQIQFHRQFYRGYEFNVSYVYGTYYRLGGNTWRDSKVYESPVFLPGAVNGTDTQAANLDQNYLQDTSMPRQQVKYDWVANLPVGKGKWLLGNSNKLVDALVGGWEISGTGTMNQYLWQPSSSDWGPTRPLHYYGRSKPIQDCTSGTCRKAYLAYNGWIPSYQYNTAKGYQGLPGDYNSEKNGLAEHQPLQPDQGTNYAPETVNNSTNHTFQLNDGSYPNNVAYSAGPNNTTNPNYKIYLPNPFNFTTNASLFKVFKIREGLGLKVNGDFFNVFNQQGTTGVSGGNGIITTTSSANQARIVQISARLTW